MSSKVSLGAPARFRWQVVLGSSLIAVTFLMAMPKIVDGQVSETPNRWIRGVAKVTLDGNGKSQITFNPQRCRELGPELCEFFRTHEYGHVNLRHLERGVPAPRAEAEADIWAARNASPSAVKAAKQFFLSGQGGSRVHGSPQERARRMDVGRSSATSGSTNVRSSTSVRSSTNARSPSQTSAAKGKRPAVKTTPKSYSATSKRWVRYRVKPSTSSSNTVRSTTARTQVTQSTSKNKTTKPAQSTSKPTRYVVLSPPKVSKTQGRTSSGYVPRGDFLNPK